MRAKSIMVQGTASSVGKSLVTAGLCRIFRQDGRKVAPFKSQNMALNSYVTSEGGEMGRAQVVQAEAAGTEPSVMMNPILLKPTADTNAQVIINGKVYGNMTAAEYQSLKPSLADMVRRTYAELAESYDIIVIEGAGSPAEINLRERDFVNMGMAEIADAPVILVGDIDRGGVFASIAGTMLLLTEEERARVKGIVINKFRGDIDILKPGIKMLEDIVKVPVLGILPYMSLNIDDEDGFMADKCSVGGCGGIEKDIDIAVIRYPYMSNDSDFNMLESIPGVGVRYVSSVISLGKPDMIVLPGSKNTVSDLLFLKGSGLETGIKKLCGTGVPVLGICGGYQMLGKSISDPHHAESGRTETEGLGLLDLSTVFLENKTTTQVEGFVASGCGVFEGLEGRHVAGYEIHMGTTSCSPECLSLLTLSNINRTGEAFADGAVNEDGSAAGTYMHGIFDSADFTAGLINNLRGRKGLPPLENELQQHRAFKDGEYDRLAGMMRMNLDINAIYEIIDGKA